MLKHLNKIKVEDNSTHGLMFISHFRISTMTDWKSDDITGKDLYTFCHPGDLLVMKKVHVDRKQILIIYTR